jgi:hypothetical protein
MYHIKENRLACAQAINSFPIAKSARGARLLFGLDESTIAACRQQQ